MLISTVLQEMEPPSILNCELRPYQKQALHWMTQLEIGATAEDASRTLHPCWEAYQLAEYVSYFLFLCGRINCLFTVYDSYCHMNHVQLVNMLLPLF